VNTHKAPTPSGQLSSVGSALRLLKAFTAEEPELGITDLAKRLGVAKSTAHRLASTLVAEGFLEQNAADGRYRLGVLLFSIGTLVRRRMNVSEQAVPHLQALCETSGETVHLAVLHDTEVVFLRNIESKQAIRPRSYLGVRKPAFCTSEGRALLAFGPPQQVSAVMRSTFAPRTPKTLTDKAVITRLLQKIRTQGFAVDDEESEVGMRGIAAPIFDARGLAVASVGVVGPVQRFTAPRQRALAAMVTATAQAISTHLGHQALEV
jgi:DNA-binding IclR family transcriptional regulator